MQKNSIIEFSLGYNFDSELIEKIAELNKKFRNNKIVNEFFAALQNTPFLSTRPNHRIKSISWNEFSSQIKRMKKIRLVSTTY